jgi:molybdopterin molybdotransferase
MISVEGAQKIILENAKPVAPKSVPLQESLGLVLATDIHAPTDLPPFTSSAMDGFALRSADTKGASLAFPLSVKVIEDLPAGKIPTEEITSGTCARMMTGAAIPKGADAVIPVEDTEPLGKFIKIKRPVSFGENIRYQGEDIKKGKFLQRGILLRPQEIALLAAFGRNQVPVFPRVSVAILSTGNELVPVSKNLAPGKIRDSNSFALEALLKIEGALPVRLGIAKDNLKSLREKIKKGLNHDILLVAGGISVGAHDLVKKVFLELGVKEIFWKVRIKPGKPLFFGKRKEALIFGLPGNPASSFVAFEIFVRPALRAKMGRKDALPAYQKAVLLQEISHHNERVDFIRATVTRRDGALFVRSSGRQGSHCLGSLCHANALIRLGENISRLKQGEEAEVLFL